MSEPILNAGPCIKIPGGKTRLLKHILPLLPERITNYHEPFLGGGATYLALRREGRIDGVPYLADINPLLVNLYWCLAFRHDEVVENLREIGAKFDSEAGYYLVREELNEWLGRIYALDSRLGLDSVWQAAQFLFLGRRGFNGLVRQNRRGHWNVAWGKDTTRELVQAEKLVGVSAAMRQAYVVRQSFEESLAKAQAGDTIYLDPPYVPVGIRSDFTDYSKDGFGMEMQASLATLALECRNRGAHVVVSQSSAPIVQELYPESHWHRHEVEVARVINRNKDGRGRVKEVILVAK